MIKIELEKPEPVYAPAEKIAGYGHVGSSRWHIDGSPLDLVHPR